MKRTPVRPYSKSSKIEKYLQQWLPECLHFVIFCVSGGIGLIMALSLNVLLVVFFGLRLELAYAIVIPLQFALNFLISRRFVFEAQNGNALRQSSFYLPASLGLRLVDWLLYVFLVNTFPIAFWLAQILNALILQLARYKLAKFIFSEKSDSASSTIFEPESQDGIIIGNVTNKSNLQNPIASHMVKNFDHCLSAYIAQANPAEIHEIGCGEGRLAQLIYDRFDIAYRGSDFSYRMIDEAKLRNIPHAAFKQADIYQLSPHEDSADTIICCEVFEHLENPEEALKVIQRLNARQYILSVPNEPVWRLLNLARLKYTADRGNTPGHLNHWSSASFRQMLMDNGFRIISYSKPFPWTMVRGYFE